MFKLESEHLLETNAFGNAQVLIQLRKYKFRICLCSIMFLSSYIHTYA